MTANDDGLYPARNGLWDLLEDDRFAKDGAAEDVADLGNDCWAGVSWKEKSRGERLTVPFGLFHICLSLNSSTRASSGVMVAHFTPT